MWRKYQLVSLTFLLLIHVIFSPPALRAHTPPPPPPDDFMNDDIDSYLIAMDTSIAPGPSATRQPTPPLAVSTCLKQTVAANHRTRLHSEEEEEEEDETDDSGAPPNKKVPCSFHTNTLKGSKWKKLVDKCMTGGEIFPDELPPT